MPNDILAQLANDPYYVDAVKLVQGLNQSGDNDTSLDEYLAKRRAERANTKPASSLPKELGKAIGRGVLGVPKLAARAAQGGALDIGALLGHRPEQNTVAQTLGKAAEAIQNIQQNPTLAPNEQYTKEHPIVNFVGENIEGALPWIVGAAASKIPVVGPAVLPVTAGLSTQAESTEQQMKRGVEGTEALARSVAPAATTGALFAAMPKAMGVLKGVPSATIETGIKKGILPGMLGRPGGAAKGALQGLFAEAPYLYGQGELTQAAGLASGAITPEEWKQTHTPEAIAHALGTSAVGGLGFGAIGAIGQKGKIEASKEEYKNLHQPIVDDKTPVDLNQKPVIENLPAGTPEYKPYIQQDLPIQTAMDLVPGGSAVYSYTDALKLTKQLRDMHVNPIIEHAGFDESGGRLARVSLPKITSIAQPEATASIENTPTEVLQTASEPITNKNQLDLFAPKENLATEQISKPEAQKQEELPDDLKEYITDFMTNPNSSVDAASLSQIIGIPEEELLAKREQALQQAIPGTDTENIRAGGVEGGENQRSESIVESPEGQIIPLAEATKRAKELVGEATPESEAARLSKKQERGYRNTKLARNILAKIHEDGFITKENFETLKSDASNLEDVPKKDGIVRKDRIQDYLEDTEGVLDKAVKDGILRKEKGGFSYGLAKNKTAEDLQNWYNENIKILGKKRVNAAEGVPESEKPTIEQNIAGDTDRFPTKADNARIDRAAAEREEVTANAQRPHTIYQERMGAFKDELGRIAREIKKLPDGVKKTILYSEFAKASKKFNKLIREGNFNKLKKEALPIYEKLGERLLQIKKYYEIQKGVDPELAQEHLDKALKDFKKSDTYKQFEAILNDLKSQARNIGRLELGEKLNEFREGVEEGKKVRDLTGIEEVESAENQRLREEQKSIKTREETLGHAEDMKFLDEMSSKRVSDEDRIDNADEIIRMAEEFYPDAGKVYAKQKSNKQKSLNLKKLAYDTWNKKNIAIRTKQLASIEVPKPLPNKRELGEAKTAKELEREQNPELKSAYEKQQENIRALKERKEAATQRQIERLKSERKGLETKEEAKTRIEKEAKEKIESEKQKAAKEKAELEERKEIAKKLQSQPEEKPVEFGVKFNKKGEPISKADKEYTKFAESKQTVGASSAIPKAAHTFVSHLTDKFGLDKMFIVTESDLKNSNIKDASLTAREIYDEKGDYVGMLHSTTDGIDILALNDSRIANEKTLVNTLSHEVGHAIINKHFESASAETKQAIQNDFNSWLSKLEKKDSVAMNELYQESGKTWEDFKKDYEEMVAEDISTGEFDINTDGVFHEYLAEQIAKYIKVTESQPKGILARFFNTLAEKLNYILRFANKEFAKNHMPIQSVAKWLDEFNKQEKISVKKNTSLKKKTKVTYDDFKYVAKQVHNVFDPDKNDSVVKGMTDLVGANLADKGIVKQGWKGIMRLPWWREEVRPATENYEKSLETAVLLKQFLKATSHLDEGVPNVISLKNIEQSYNKIAKTSREIISKLLVEGDKEEVNWTSPKEIKSETLKNISKEDFDIYKKTRDFVDQAWRRDLQNQSDTLAYSLTENKELQDKLGSAIRLKEIDSKTKLKDFLESQPSIKAKGGLNSLITPEEFNVIADAIYESGGIKDFYKEYSRDYATTSLPGYIPRERLDGAEWLVELSKKDGTKIFSQGFYTKAEAQKFLEEFKQNPERYAPKNIKYLKEFVGKYPTQESANFKSLLDEPILRPISDQERFNLDDEKLIADKVSTILNKIEGVPNKVQIISAVRKEIMNHILAKRGMQNRVQRSEQLIEGYNEDSPLDAIQTALDKSAYRQARMRYIIDQSRLLSKTKDVQKKNAIREYVSRTLEPPVTGSKQVQMFKNMAAIYFMGFRPLTALMQLTQLHTVGAADLGMYLKQYGIKDSAQKLITKAELDVRSNKLTKIEKDILKMAEERGVTWENSSQSFMFKDVDSVTSKHFLGKRVVKLSEIALKMFQFMEQHNRQSAILAAYRIFSKGSAEFNQEAFDKAMKYNNNTNFMMNKGNVPYWTMKHPIGMSIYTLMSYTLNMANWMLNRSHGSLSDLNVDKWTQRQAFMKMLGYTAVLAGASGLPFSDDLNKLIRKIFGRDLHLETKQFIKQNAGEDIANLVADGVFAPLGVNVSSNVAIRVPFLSGLLDGQTVGESVSGAAGALAMKGVNAAEAAYTGQGRKFVEAISPEVLAGALRAERLYREGQRTPSGKLIYFEGKPVKSTGPEALMQGLFGIKSERRANIMNISDSEYKLAQHWNDKKKIAESKAAKGDYSAIQEFNRELLKDKTARMLIKSAKLAPSKPNKERTAFELAQ